MSFNYELQDIKITRKDYYECFNLNTNKRLNQHAFVNKRNEDICNYLNIERM